MRSFKEIKNGEIDIRRLRYCENIEQATTNSLEFAPRDSTLWHQSTGQHQQSQPGFQTPRVGE